MSRIVLLLLALTLLLPLNVHAFDASGTYSTSEGNMSLRQSVDKVTGSYGQNNGEIIGLMFDNVLEGFWIQKNSGRRCQTAKHGHHYWGRISFTFDSSGFTGKWSYCEDAPSSSWTGKLTSKRGANHERNTTQTASTPVLQGQSSQDISGLWKSSIAPITFQQSGNRVSGKYSSDGGEIVGIINNNLLVGYWIENSSARKCSSAKNGRYHWGKIEFKFTGNSFTGKWGYCDGPPTEGSWNGSR